MVKIIDITDENYEEQDFINELKILQDIARSDFECFPKLKDWGVTSLEQTYQISEINDKSKFLVQNKLGKGVSTIFYKHKKYFKKMDVLKLGIQMIKNIEGLHTLGYVHRDIKPDNILVELDKKARIYDHQVIDIDYEIREHVQRGRLKTNSNHPYHS